MGLQKAALPGIDPLARKGCDGSTTQKNLRALSARTELPIGVQRYPHFAKVYCLHSTFSDAGAALQ